MNITDFDTKHPRVMKLIAKNRDFLVVSEDEPYFRDVYRTIREHEFAKGTWTIEDENLYRNAMRKHSPSWNSLSSEDKLCQ